MMQKMWQRLLGSLLSIILIVPFCFVTAKADTNEPVVFTNTYGSFTQSFYSDGHFSYNDVIINLKDNYTGTIILNWTYNANDAGNNLSRWSYLVYGGYISSVANNKLTIKIVDCNQLEIHLVTRITTSENPSYAAWRFDFTGWTFSGSETVYPLETTANSIDGKLTTMNTTLNTIKNTLTTLASSITGSNGTTLDDLLDQLKDMDDLFVVGSGTNNYETIAEIVYQIRSRLTEFTNSWGFDQNNDFYTMLQTIKIDIEQTITVANGILSTLNTMSTTLTNINNSVSNIDTLIDTVTWKQNNTSYYFKGYSTDRVNIVTSLSSSVQILAGNTVYFHFKSFASTTPTLYYFRIPFSFGNLGYFGSDIELEFYNGQGKVINPVYYCSNSDAVTHIFYFGRTSTSYDLIIGLKASNNGYVYSNTFSGSFLKWMENTDIEYWQLLNYVNEYNYQMNELKNNDLVAAKLDEIINAIGNVSVSSSDITNVTYNFDTNIETINNIHNTYNQMFNDYKDNVQNYDFNLNLDLTNSSRGINDLFTRFYNIDFFRIPILIIMACAIFLIVLG